VTPLRAKRTGGRRRLDAIDRAILEVLRGEGRITNQALAERIGLSPRPTLERVRKLEAAGVIRGYAALLDPAATGHAVAAFALLVLRDPSAAAKQRLETVLKGHPAVVEAHVVAGEAEYLVRFVAESLQAYERLTADILADPGLGVARIETTFVLKTIAEFRGYPVHAGG